LRINCKNKKINLDIIAPPSKSIYHRELIVRFLSGVFGRESKAFAPGDLLVVEEGDSVDIRATKECLSALWEVYKNHSDKVVLPCHESGSTIRFMVPVASAFIAVAGIDAELVFETEGRLFDRPMDQLSDCLKPHGVIISKNESDRTIRVNGKLVPGVFVIDGSVSSQYISGLLMALPLFAQETKVEITNGISSIHYIELTTNVLSKYEVETIREDNVFIPDARGYKAINSPDFNVEGDWSNGAFLLCLGALLRGGEINVTNLNLKSAQGDADILNYLKELGIIITEKDGVLTIKDQVSDVSSLTSEVTWDCTHIPDIAPYMAVMAAFFTKKTTLTGISRLRIKESDRAMATREVLTSCGFTVEENEDSLVIFGGIPVIGREDIKLTSYNDHRMAMVAVMLAAGLGASIEIDEIKCMTKSFPALPGVIERQMS